jgi:hypothetical protein
MRKNTMRHGIAALSDAQRWHRQTSIGFSETGSGLFKIESSP